MSLTVDERFWMKVGPPIADGCWPWLASTSKQGYGQFAVRDGVRVTQFLAHRFAYQKMVGPVPEGLELDHLCRNRACVNPAHLEAVSHHANILRGVGFAATHSQRTHCPQGHPYDEANTYCWKGRRACRMCKKERSQAQYLRLKDSARLRLRMLELRERGITRAVEL